MTEPLDTHKGSPLKDSPLKSLATCNSISLLDAMAAEKLYIQSYVTAWLILAGLKNFSLDQLHSIRKNVTSATNKPLWKYHRDIVERFYDAVIADAAAEPPDELDRSLLRRIKGSRLKDDPRRRHAELLLEECDEARTKYLAYLGPPPKVDKKEKAASTAVTDPDPDPDPRKVWEAPPAYHRSLDHRGSYGIAQRADCKPVGWYRETNRSSRNRETWQGNDGMKMGRSWELKVRLSRN